MIKKGNFLSFLVRDNAEVILFGFLSVFIFIAVIFLAPVEMPKDEQPNRLAFETIVV